MKYEVYRTERFDKEAEKLSRDENNRIDKVITRQLEENPYVGDQLQIKILREKRLDEKRIYYLVFDDLKAVLMIAISGKKAQQKIIDFIIENINNYRDYLKERMNKD